MGHGKERKKWKFFDIINICTSLNQTIKAGMRIGALENTGMDHYRNQRRDSTNGDPVIRP